MNIHLTAVKIIKIFINSYKYMLSKLSPGLLACINERHKVVDLVINQLTQSFKAVLISFLCTVYKPDQFPILSIHSYLHSGAVNREETRRKIREGDFSSAIMSVCDAPAQTGGFQISYRAYLEIHLPY